MSKTVLKQGVDPDYEYVAKCSICGTVFKYKYSDMEGDPIQAWHEPHITCPTCNYMLAMTDKPIKEIDFTIDGASLFRTEHCILIPSGCQVYVLYQNGSTISLRNVTSDEITPTGAPLLIVGTASKITIVPGVEILSPDPALTYARMVNLKDVLNKTSYITITNQLEYDQVTDQLFGLPPTQVNTNTSIVVLE